MVAVATMPQIPFVFHYKTAKVQLSETSEFVCNWFQQKWELKSLREMQSFDDILNRIQ